MTETTNSALEVGDRMKDGSIFAGISPETGRQMFAMPADVGIAMNFHEAAQYAKHLNVEKSLGHDDWGVPTKAELNVLFNNRAAIGNFNISGSDPCGWYWSGTPVSGGYAYDQRFSDGLQNYTVRGIGSSVRCVR